MNILCSNITRDMAVGDGDWRHSQNISFISWRSILGVEETGVPGENNWPAASYWQTIT